LRLSAIVLYLNANDAGPGFFTKAMEPCVVATNATRDERERFWLDQLGAVQDHYQRGGRPRRPADERP